MNKNWTVLMSAGVCLAALNYPQAGNAAGFAILEQSASRLGTAYAGSGAMAEDASEVWYNPAAAAHIGTGMNLGLHYIDASFEFGDAQVSPEAGALLASSRVKDDGGTTAVLPNLAYTAEIGGGWFGGFTINAPFGLATEYKDDWIGRYQTLDSDIASINLNPFVAFRLNDEWSFGAGVSINQTEVTLSRAMDYAAICAQAVGGLCPNGARPGAGEFDGEVEAEGDDIGYGYNLGVIWSPAEDTRVSLSYRSEIDFELEGDGTFSAPVARGGFEALGPLLGGGLAATFSSSDNTADLTLPDTLALSYYQGIGDRLSLLADVTWTGWSTLDAIVIEFDNPLTPTAVEPLGWDDTMRYSLGLSFDANEAWTLRAGVAYDETPVPNARLRTPRLPDNDRTWLALGASTEVADNAVLDISYTHILLDDTDIIWEEMAGGTVAGEYESEGNALSVGLSLRF
ncbi:OmpP1/FadL family transporter [Gilvimarinus sp. F26214L]|uniref:OmpP1/FadL family transporter n=1 Tax=Gilvimarinus sp. DZF01 TaxID=3461371 RepID=UPI004045A1BC